MYFYWAKDAGIADADVYVLDLKGNVVDTFIGAAPPHGADIHWRESTDTLICSSGGSAVPEIREINKTTGATIHSWDCTGIGYNQNALVAHDNSYNPSTFYLFTGDASFNIKVTIITAADNNTFVEGATASRSNLYVPQGLVYKDGFLYLLSDSYPSKSNRMIRKLNTDLSGGVLATYMFPTSPQSKEGEGLEIYQNRFYFGSLDRGTNGLSIFRTANIPFLDSVGSDW